jgi:hypothetical protein
MVIPPVALTGRPASGVTVTVPVIPEVNEPVSTPLLMLQLRDVATPVPDKVQIPLASEANPYPLTVITLLVLVMDGERVTEGVTAKEVVPVSVVVP